MIDKKIINSLISPFEPTHLKDYRELYQDKRFVSVNPIEHYLAKSGTYRTIVLIRCEYNDGEHIINFDLKKTPGDDEFYVRNKTFINKSPNQYFEYTILEEDNLSLFERAILITKKQKPYSSNPNKPSIIETTDKGYIFTFYLRKKPYSIEESVLSQFATIDKINPFNTFIDNRSLSLLEMYCIN